MTPPAHVQTRDLPHRSWYLEFNGEAVATPAGILAGCAAALVFTPVQFFELEHGHFILAVTQILMGLTAMLLTTMKTAYTYRDRQVSSAAEVFARYGLLNGGRNHRERKRRRMRLQQLDSRANKHNDAISALSHALRGMQKIESPEPLLAQELEERLHQQQQYLENVHQEARQYIHLELCAALGFDPETPENQKRLREDEILGEALEALKASRHSE